MKVRVHPHTLAHLLTDRAPVEEYIDYQGDPYGYLKLMKGLSLFLLRLCHVLTPLQIE